MSKKTYLSDQIKLMTLSTYDFFTDEEAAVYHEIISLINQIAAKPENVEALKAEKKAKQKELSSLIALHEDKPRIVNMKAVLSSSALQSGIVSAVSWQNLKLSRRITEFASTMSRALNLNPGDITFDKMIVKWKSVDMLRQLVLNGFDMPVVNTDGAVLLKHYIFYTSSAGQLRTDKCQFIAESAWEKIRAEIECGLTPERFNQKGGINVN